MQLQNVQRSEELLLHFPHVFVRWAMRFGLGPPLCLPELRKHLVSDSNQQTSFTNELTKRSFVSKNKTSLND